MSDKEQATSLDAIAMGLQALRIEAGDVSYAELAKRIAARRIELGRTPGAARIARSTVFDVFQPGRQRVNPDLVKEIAAALGSDEVDAESWRQRCLAAQRAKLLAAPAPVAKPAAPAAPPPVADDAGARALRLTFIATMVMGCIGINLFGGAFVARLQLPIFLDMVGTATAAFVLGPWWGALVGLSTNTLGVFTTELNGLPFALVNMAGAIVWGWGIRRFAHTIPRFIGLNLLTAFVCTTVATPVYVLVFGGLPGHGSEMFMALRQAGDGIWSVIFLVNLLVSILDKLISGALALVLARALVRLPVVAGTAPIPPLLRSRTPTFP